MSSHLVDNFFQGLVNWLHIERLQKPISEARTKLYKEFLTIFLAQNPMIEAKHLWAILIYYNRILKKISDPSLPPNTIPKVFDEEIFIFKGFITACTVSYKNFIEDNENDFTIDTRAASFFLQTPIHDALMTYEMFFLKLIDWDLKVEFSDLEAQKLTIELLALAYYFNRAPTPKGTIHPWTFREISPQAAPIIQHAYQQSREAALDFLDRDHSSPQTRCRNR